MHIDSFTVSELNTNVSLETSVDIMSCYPVDPLQMDKR